MVRAGFIQTASHELQGITWQSGRNVQYCLKFVSKEKGERMQLQLGKDNRLEFKPRLKFTMREKILYIMQYHQ